HSSLSLHDVLPIYVGVLLEIRERADVGVARVDSLLREPRREPDAGRNAARRPGFFRRLVRSDGEREEVRRYLGSLHESRPRASVGERVGLLDRHVRYGHQAGGVDQLEREARFEFGLIEAWVGAARVRRLELRCRGALTLSYRPVETPKRLADLSVPGDLQDAVAFGDLVLETQRRRLRLAVVRDLAHRWAAQGSGALDVEVDRVEGDLAHRVLWAAR